MKKVILSMVIGLGMVSQANAFEGDAAAGKAKAATCTACHGADGIGLADNYPNLAGQHADYIAKQLKAFKNGDRKDALMAPMAANLSDQDMADLGAYFQNIASTSATAGTETTSAPVAAAPAAVVANASAGKAIYQNGDKARGITACITCHGKDGNSLVEINPNLANQHPEYIEKQLAAFKSGSRIDAAMNQVAGNLADTDIANLGAYFKDTDAVGEITAANAPVAVVKSFTGNVEAGKTKAVTCAACHGADGNATVALYPSLAGQSEKYLANQLRDFKKAVETNNAEGRVDPVMAGMVAPLSANDINDLAAFFAAQTLKPAVAQENAAGKALYVSGDAKRGITACIACHGVNGQGMDSAGFPAIAGQSEAYIKAQLEKFRTGSRANDLNGMMQNIAIKLKDEDIAAISQHVASMK